MAENKWVSLGLFHPTKKGAPCPSIGLTGWNPWDADSAIARHANRRKTPRSCWKKYKQCRCRSRSEGHRSGCVFRENTDHPLDHTFETKWLQRGTAKNPALYVIHSTKNMMQLIKWWIKWLYPTSRDPKVAPQIPSSTDLRLHLSKKRHEPGWDPTQWIWIILRQSYAYRPTFP